MASREIETARRAGRVPILVGGTGLYFHAAMNGLAPVPDVPPEVHAACVAEYAERGGEAFRRELLEIFFERKNANSSFQKNVSPTRVKIDVCRTRVSKRTP